MTIEQWEARRQAHAMAVHARITGQMLVRTPDRPQWGALPADEAAKRVGAFASEIRDAARNCHRRGGLRWHEDGKPWAPARSRRAGVPVRCVETGDRFISAAAAARWAEQYTGTKLFPTAINWATLKGRAICGLHFTRTKPAELVAEKVKN